MSAIISTPIIIVGFIERHDVRGDAGNNLCNAADGAG